MQEYRKEIGRTETVETSPATQRGAFKAEMIVYWVAGIIEFLLLIRIVLGLLGANKGNGFAQFIYSITQPFVQPFYGLFNTTFQFEAARFEYEAIVALVVVAFIAWAITKLIEIIRR